MHKVNFEPTPNPHTYRFTLPKTGLITPLEFYSPQEALSSPLAQKIFGFPWTHSILLGSDFIAITKHDWVDWDILSQPLAQLIQEHINLNLPLWSPQNQDFAYNMDINEQDSPLLKQIKEWVYREIRPILAMDGGDLKIMDLKDGVLYVSFKGACVGCPSTQITLKEGIEVRLKEVFAEINQVELI